MDYFTRRDFIKSAAVSLLLLSLPGCALFDFRERSSRSDKEKNDSKLFVKEVDCDFFLKNGLIHDGKGGKPFYGNVAIKDNKIAAIGSDIANKNGEIIDVEGLIIAPGFIDLHTHTEEYFLKNGKGEMILHQGVTTHIGGNCGSSVDSIGDYFNNLGAVGINFGIFTGLRNIRFQTVGNKADTLSANELNKMKELVQKGMEEGAFGLSVGLEYWPQIYTTTEELIELCRVVSDYGGFYSTHIRNEEDHVLSAVEEAIKIGREAGLPVQYSHIKTAQKRNWGKMSQVLELLENASDEGLDITADVYGYTFSGHDRGTDRNSISEQDMLQAFKHPLVMVASDAGLQVNGDAVHPRTYGNFPRFLGRYVRNRRVMSMGECIKKMTSMPARRLGLEDRGVLKEGNKADITVFDYMRIIDRAERDNINVLSEGVKHVFVNGKHSVKDGEVTGVLAGEKLLKNKKEKADKKAESA